MEEAPPGLVPPGPRRLRMAWAPKLMRRAKGELGAVRGPPGPTSSSSMAFSSKAASDADEFVDMLARRAAKDDTPAPDPLLPTPPALAGDVPDRPRAAVVETERRRRRFWSMAADVMGPGKTGVPLEAFEVELLPKMLERAAEVTELRRWRDLLSAELLSLEAIVSGYGAKGGRGKKGMPGSEFYKLFITGGGRGRVGSSRGDRSGRVALKAANRSFENRKETEAKRAWLVGCFVKVPRKVVRGGAGVCYARYALGERGWPADESAAERDGVLSVAGRG